MKIELKKHGLAAGVIIGLAVCGGGHAGCTILTPIEVVSTDAVADAIHAYCALTSPSERDAFSLKLRPKLQPHRISVGCDLDVPGQVDLPGVAAEAGNTSAEDQ